MTGKHGPAPPRFGNHHGRGPLPKAEIVKQDTQPPSLPKLSTPQKKTDAQGKTRNFDAAVLPMELIEVVMEYLLDMPSTSKLTPLLVCSSLTRLLKPIVYRHVTLTNLAALQSFHAAISSPSASASNSAAPRSTSTSEGSLARKVRSLYIAPLSLSSDLWAALSPSALPTMRTTAQAHSLVRQILRACRSLQHLALDGALLNKEAAASYGTSCKPRSLTSVNPHSYVGGFSAPIFSKCTTCHLIDGSLTHEEVREIRGMAEVLRCALSPFASPGLRHFSWTSPREHNSALRDVDVMLRILTGPQPPGHTSLDALVNNFQALDITPLILGAEQAQRDVASAHNSDAIEDVAQLGALEAEQQDRDAAQLTRTDAGFRLGSSTRAVNIKSLTMRCPESRSALVGTQLQRVAANKPGLTSSSPWDHRFSTPSFATNSDYIDSSAAHTRALHAPSGVMLCSQPLPSEELVEEWEALRDTLKDPMLLYNAMPGGHYRVARPLTPPKSGQGHGDEHSSDDQEAEIDPAMCLRRIHTEWLSDVLSGKLDRESRSVAPAISA
ncbi:hypothetical protein IE81DRAFT_61035 [Ceraceosorus guamensis]|uniref:Uncharacterized protein n=1 Tax=Ceraceosorus guamensis TaxID=1522189 RepID=A0A316W558_9BASI|nr:hypothetical protein IE81DRAFT_61035 [Ceraceosorus guamensis]PWN43831.1 hypothetical protein IE81DRAFT_61035 [Ceraceosorus guamensis]